MLYYKHSSGIYEPDNQFQICNANLWEKKKSLFICKMKMAPF